MAPPPSLQQTLSPLTEAVWTLSALAAATECGLVAALAEPRPVVALVETTRVPRVMVERLVDVMASLGLVSLAADTVTPSAALVALVRDPGAFVIWRDELRRSLGQPRDLVADARRGRLGTGWHHEDPDLIEAQGTFARVHTRLLMVEGIVPELPGLGAALGRPGARILDVGAGAAGNAIAFCHAWPTAAVVGLEPWAPSLALGQVAVAAAGLGARVALRAQRVEDLAEADGFDMIWLPQMFLDGPTLGRALGACRAALRPGGWLLTAWICDEHAPGTSAALARLRDVAFGGEARGADRCADLVAAAGLVDLRRKAFAGGAIGMVAGRRAQSPATAPV